MSPIFFAFLLFVLTGVQWSVEGSHCAKCYTGSRCETYRDSCTDCNWCNHGHCELTDTSDCESETKCVCEAEYSGRNCSIPTPPPPTKPQRCPRCYYGADCRTYRDSCTDYKNQCGAHGRCELSNPTDCKSEPKCVCDHEWTGQFCTVKECKLCDRCHHGPLCETYRDSCTGNNQCGAHGHCKLTIHGDCKSEPKCECDHGYYGEFCQHKVCQACYSGPNCATYWDSCSGHNRCGDAGHGHCQLSNPSNCMSDAICVCRDGWSGKCCNIPPYIPYITTPEPTVPTEPTETEPTYPTVKPVCKPCPTGRKCQQSCTYEVVERRVCDRCHTGNNCEIYHDSCTDCTDCSRHGHGRCVLRDPNDCTSRKTCRCTDGYRGRYCNYPPYWRHRRELISDENSDGDSIV